MRDEVVTFVQKWQSKTEYDVTRFINWLGIGRSKYYSWVQRQGLENQHNGPQPKHHWLTDSEKAAIVNYYADHRSTGYRRLAYMMLDEDVVAASPSSVYRWLLEAGLLRPSQAQPSSKGQGFRQPERPHQHWHIDITYLNISGTFYYLCAILDGYSRFIVHWEIRPAMTEADVEIILQRAREQIPPMPNPGSSVTMARSLLPVTSSISFGFVRCNMCAHRPTIRKAMARLNGGIKR